MISLRFVARFWGWARFGAAGLGGAGYGAVRHGMGLFGANGSRFNAGGLTSLATQTETQQ